MACSTSSTSLDGLGDPKNGGALFILPREVRDEIYRLVVNGTYVWASNSHDFWSKTSGFWSNFPSTYGAYLPILQVSKAINYEASEIWLSESDFEFVMDIDRAIVVPPTKLTDFAKKVEIYFDSSDEYASTYELGMLRPDYHKEVIAPFTGTHTARQSLTLNTPFEGQHIQNDRYLRKFFEACTTLTSFRTVNFQIDIIIHLSWHEYPDSVSFEEMISVATEQMERETEAILGPLLGPAKCRWERNETIYFTFHPLQYVVDNAKQQPQQS